MAEEHTIDSLLQEDRTFPPPPEFEVAELKPSDPAIYRGDDDD